MANETTPTTSYFDELVGKTDEQAKQEEIKLARRQLQRKLASAFDSAESQVIKNNAAVRGMFDQIRRDPRNGVERFDVNTFIAVESETAALVKTKETVRAQYERLFGEKLPEF